MEVCPICLERFFEGMEVAELPRFHTFHKGCIFKWLVVANSCPMCINQAVQLVSKLVLLSSLKLRIVEYLIVSVKTVFLFP